ncbi:peptide chain release factor N(5)-glutamine methyltransferase [Roseovarius rhodophyticola]|uniref:Release factor glutamine methyltransferase n=1 Tax=Roseovarius rhodophyticola TaxID=3080827 RepID=A0ABZ2TG29_9RHOB|nr:peptide chain release factor N(5)-glutamine methyltransferase [Roseovarius sp. W115]MDV2928496.1 peptide chain release factor N(5)-glutamine methyltransferase [Roseovarius sp. W115]
MSQVFGDLVQQAKDALERAGIEGAAREARILAAKAADIPVDRASLSFQEVVAREAQSKLEAFIASRVLRMPLSHITGTRAFYAHEFTVTPDVLDPRPETETLIETALESDFQHVLDLGTGSGCILLSLLAARSEAAGVGTDKSPRALDVALENAARLGVTDRCLFLRSDWYSDVEGQFDLIVSNPPYISAQEMENLQPELTHEPRMALTDEMDGLSAYRGIIPGAGAHLRPNGRLLVEIGWTQRTPVVGLYEQSGFTDINITSDMDGRDRVVSGVWQGA